ncbi:hypothetical protein D9757_008326 [Collybiopsis confluens]|uniref:VWFA domain-containing protein n=1 Tax=Collybiopsis confluens TaxID=2823264 RepID=A0A8H5HEJ8_9AGAR|nr:hypothetical protein D9757_008326 [Collybiopsis confluens]
MSSFKPPNIFPDSTAKAGLSISICSSNHCTDEDIRMPNGMQLDDLSDFYATDEEDENDTRPASRIDITRKMNVDNDTRSGSPFDIVDSMDVDDGHEPERLDHDKEKGKNRQSSHKETLNPDLAQTIRGMYRILDLISEQGSGGLGKDESFLCNISQPNLTADYLFSVDKIIITQDSLERFINDVVPGAYTSMTKVDFKALDKIGVKPVGVYGSKAEIVKLLFSIHAVDDGLAQLLLKATDDSSGPKLRPGLYFVRVSPAPDGVERIIVLFWPEDTTWDDGAISSVRRNRITFMRHVGLLFRRLNELSNPPVFPRYLSKIADQTMCLVSEAHTKAIVWNDTAVDESEKDAIMEEPDDDNDRLFIFEVNKTNEQEESVKTRPGIRMTTSVLDPVPLPPDCPLGATDLRPAIIPGETSQGILTKRFVPLTTTEEIIRNDMVNRTAFRSILQGCRTLSLGDKLTDAGIHLLADNGLADFFPDELREWRKRGGEIDARIRAQQDGELEELKEKTERMKKELAVCIRGAMLERVGNMYPMLNLSDLLKEHVTPDTGGDKSTGEAGDGDEDGNGDKGGDVDAHGEKEGTSMPDEKIFASFANLYPGMRTKFEDLMGHEVISKLQGNFRAHKARVMTVYVLMHVKGLSPEDRKEAIVAALSDREIKTTNAQSYMYSLTLKLKTLPWVRTFATTEPLNLEQRISAKITQLLKDTEDPTFLKNLGNLRKKEPSLEEAISSTIQAAETYLTHIVQKNFEILLKEAETTQQKTLERKISDRCSAEKDRLRQQSVQILIGKIRSKVDPDSPDLLIIEKIELAGNRIYDQRLTYGGRRRRRSDPMLEYKIQPITLTSDDLQNLRLDKTYVPTPKVGSRAANVFQLPIHFTVQHIQLLKNEKCLLVVNTGTEFRVFCERPAALENAIRISHGKSLHQSKLGNDVLVAFDESTRTLAIVACERLQLHLYSYDENISNLRAQEPVNLSQWYPSGTSIRLACFVSGVDELLLADSQGQLRIFAQVTQQFRPATVELDRTPLNAMSSPDGSCLFLVFAEEDGFSVHAYHWSTFGSGEGTVLNIDALPDCPVVTSFDTKGSAHLVWIDFADSACRSLALDITKRVTEFSFQEQGSRRFSNSNEHQTAHNTLIDCHADVWTRFPVVPAISRQTLVTRDRRLSTRLIFVTDLNQHKFRPYFAKMIQSFEQRTRKPTGDVLKKLQIESASLDDVLSELLEESDWVVSEFRAGEWLVDVLCLIPIQLAVTRDNRFLPLKDGVSSSALEKSLLGANVSQIVDALSFGWYESIFQSYQSTKPVKVVSSMGEQSVGKSFALNHLADTSFAGSAMRTTGQFHLLAIEISRILTGVHSIERSLQEDTLLVLFNTAVSNLILFRNNFALSRDIAGMFQSFQSSSTVLDPKANPTLFQSTLVIIIKDVVESDTNEIVKEFSLKFQKIVQDEQDANFISKLHAGRLNIIPWPVIESKQFYTLFPVLKARLDKQKITHRSAGEFLQTLKTMMAKLKANDWGALSETIAAHRASHLMDALPYALTYGYSDTDQEPLVNMDTNTIIEEPDTEAIFYLTGAPFSPEKALQNLFASWDGFSGRNLAGSDRTWTEELSQYLVDLLDQRIERVRHWIDSNLARFKAEHANIDALRRMMDSAVIDLRSHVELCKMKCESCNLLCVRGRRHNGKDAHDCATNHKCAHLCEFDDGHDEEDADVPCGFAAGHTGKHICTVDTHLCGEKCDLHGKKGCLEDCVKVVGHPDEGHFCASRTHACGEPCALTHVKLTDGSTYSCPRTCTQPSDLPHSEHVCDNRECPLQCQLCSRLCSKDHLHGLDENAVHLCGETHPCKAVCMAQGICQIDTQPQSVLTTFTGQYGTFQYTKYSQVAKRLPCAISIPPDCVDHPGAHRHSTAKDPFHYCESKCEDCGYYCTLPRSHTQQLHETRHGSMSRTRWTIDDSNGAIELGGRKFGTGDDGAPMLCNLFCSDMGRHTHVDYCRAPPGQPCPPSEGIEHVVHRMQPEPDRPKDWVTHSLHWRRMGFKDPYSREDQANFAKCDAMCSGPEHAATATNSAQPSYCILPMFHPPAALNNPGMGHISNDGHHFSCKNPTVLQQAFHVYADPLPRLCVNIDFWTRSIFVIDRSSSMFLNDRRPLPNTPTTALISSKCDNRLGAVYSALYGFWASRNSALVASGTQAVRRDAYSIILFDDTVLTVLANDFTSQPDQLLNAVLQYEPDGWTDYVLALNAARNVMTQHWSTERSPVIIFLSDGLADVPDDVVDGLCREAVTRGKPLSFHSVSFGPRNDTLKRMAQISRDVQNRAPKDPLMPATAYFESSYAEALDSVRLAETFLGIANSLKKTRGALLH